MRSGVEDSLRIEGCFSFPHPVHGPAQLDRQQRVRAGFIVFLFDAFGEGFRLRALAFQERDGFRERPLQMRIPDLRARWSIALSR